MGAHQSARMMTDVWLTPPEIIAALGPFDLDPCAAPPPRPWDTALAHIALPDDGLKKDWWGRVWLNPPYSREAVKWLERLSCHERGTALIFARTETAWFVQQVWQRASALLFLDGRVYFHHASGERASANSGAPSVLVAYGEHDAERLASCGLAGSFCDGWATRSHIPKRGGRNPTGLVEGIEVTAFQDAERSFVDRDGRPRDQANGGHA